MNRRNAMRVLARHAVSFLSREQRESLLYDWWSIEADTPETQLSDELKVRLKALAEPEDPMDPVYDQLLILAIEDSYVGVANQYLAAQLRRIGHNESVCGPVELLAACVCCGYRTLRGRGGYEICRVCFWEDDGATDPNVYSGPNHMTLHEARANFNQFGAVSESVRSHVLTDAEGRFLRGTEDGGQS